MALLLFTSIFTFAQEKSVMIEALLQEKNNNKGLLPFKGKHETASIKGKDAWKLNKKEGKTLSYLYLDVNEKQYNVKGQTLTITLEYLSKGAGYIQFKYDSHDQKVKIKEHENGAWKSGKQVNFEKNNKWLTTTFTIDDARFNKKCNQHDIAIIVGSEEAVYVHSLKISRDPKSAPKVIETVSATLGENPTFNHIIAIKGNGETITAPIVIKDKEAWDIKSKANNSVKMVYFDVNAKNFIANGEKIYAYVEYLDQGNGNVVVFYDSKDVSVTKNPKAKPGAWKKALGFKLTNSGKWKKAYFEIDDARFEKNCNGHDIRINFNSNDKAIIKELKLSNSKEGLNKKVVTTTSVKEKKPAVKMNTKHGKTFNFSTADMKVYTGYQGWFNAPGDGSGLHWKHYQKNARKKDPLSAENIRVDAWPDLSEFPKSAKYDTPFKHKDGSTAQLFSSADPITQDIHFGWMKEYNIDAAFVQRFVTSAAAPHINPNLNKVLKNSLEAARKHKRGVAIMYDLSGMKGDQGVESFIKDWKELVDKIKLTTKYKDVYLSTNGKPLVAIWGVGFDPQKKTRKYYLEDCEKIIDFLQNDPVYGGCSVLLGVPTRWREGVRDATSDPLFHELIKRSDIVLPWYTGRVKTGRYNEIYPIVEGDVAWCKTEKLEFMPVLFPGFSWHNMNPETKLNQTPREKGQFFWNQMHGAAKAGAEMVYIGMFDEIDEATCFFKITSDIPVGLEMIDNEGLPSDHYLWLVKEGRKMLENSLELKEKMPSATPYK